VTTHRLLSMPIRTSAIRSLGAHFNVFAIESFMDELASRAAPIRWPSAGAIDDERARAVLLAAAGAAGWGQPPEDADTGLGLGYARYKNGPPTAPWQPRSRHANPVRVRRLVLAVDVGQVVNRDASATRSRAGRSRPPAGP